MQVKVQIIVGHRYPFGAFALLCCAKIINKCPIWQPLQKLSEGSIGAREASQCFYIKPNNTITLDTFTIHAFMMLWRKHTDLYGPTPQ